MDQQKPVDPTPLNRLGDTPQWIDCPFCHQRTETRLEKKQLGPLQIVARTLGFIVCAFCNASAVVSTSPYTTPWFKETWHSCSECQNKVAMRRQGAKVANVFGPGAEAPSQ